MDLPVNVECRQCGHAYELTSIPGRCSYCGTLHQTPAPPKSAAELKADELAAKFRLAANRAKGNF